MGNRKKWICFQQTPLVRGGFVRVKWKRANENTDGRFPAFYLTMGFLPVPLLCWFSSCSFFFFHPQVLWLMGAVCIGGFWGQCFNDTEYGAIFCVMVKGLSVPSIGSLYSVSVLLVSIIHLFVVSFMPEDKDNNTCWYLWKCIVFSESKECRVSPGWLFCHRTLIFHPCFILSPTLSFLGQAKQFLSTWCLHSPDVSRRLSCLVSDIT